MTETERWVNETCERIVAAGSIRQYKDLYKDLRQRLPCGSACGLIVEGLRRTRGLVRPDGLGPLCSQPAWRSQAIAALKRLARYAAVQESGELAGLYDGADRGM